jgi:DNA (cytosine-5)-methyltransferase 1
MSAAVAERPVSPYEMWLLEKSWAAPYPPSGITFTDFFCGFGGSSIGLTEAGLELKWAANHWELAIENHAANFRLADHYQGDISGYDMRKVPKADVAWLSPECTWHSPAGGRRRVRAELDALFPDEHVPSEAGERSRATMWDVVRAAEAKAFKVVIVENVVEVTSWPSFEAWLHAMELNGYDYQIVCVTAAHVGDELNPYAPQWRDRIYFVFYKREIPFPIIEPRPIAWCSQCEDVVESRQSWKRSDRRRVGKYGQQYVYVCGSMKHASHVVEPYVLPASTAIDWSDIGTRIGDREKPLAPATMRRIEAGIRMFARPVVAAAAGQTYDAASATPDNPRPSYRVAPADGAPLAVRTSTPGDGVAVPPFVATVNHSTKSDGRQFDPESAPLAPRTTKIGDGVVTPFVSRQYNSRTGAGRDADHLNTGVDEPLHPITANGGGNHALVTPFIDVARSNNLPRGTDEPLAPVTTGLNQSLVSPPLIIAGYDYNGGDERRVKPADGAPLHTVVANGRGHHQLVTPPIIADLHGTGTARSAEDDALGAVTAGGNHHGLTVPDGAFIQKHHGGIDYAGVGHMVKSVGEPLPAIVARVNTSLVIPYRRGRAARATEGPLPTQTTSNTTALLMPTFSAAEMREIVENSHFRMLGPLEHGRAQRFPDGYAVKGTKGARTKGFGNAVASNVAHWLGRQVVVALAGHVAKSERAG